MNMNNMKIKPSLVGLRIGLGTGRTRSGWGARVAQRLGWPRRRRYIYLETNTKIAMTEAWVRENGEQI